MSILKWMVGASIFLLAIGMVIYVIASMDQASEYQKCLNMNNISDNGKYWNTASLQVVEHCERTTLTLPDIFGGIKGLFNSFTTSIAAIPGAIFQPGALLGIILLVIAIGGIYWMYKDRRSTNPFMFQKIERQVRPSYFLFRCRIDKYDQSSVIDGGDEIELEVREPEQRVFVIGANDMTINIYDKQYSKEFTIKKFMAEHKGEISLYDREILPDRNMAEKLIEAAQLYVLERKRAGKKLTLAEVYMPRINIGLIDEQYWFGPKRDSESSDWARSETELNRSLIRQGKIKSFENIGG